ncbi:MAG: hypothetical protein RIB98_15005 [Acidimicrobiales bacterium]
MTEAVTGRRPVSDAWPGFHERLTEALRALEEDQFLNLNVKCRNRFVQFAAQGYFGMRAETVGNAYLEGPERLSIEDIAILRALGWNDPTSGPGVVPQADPDGSPNHYLEWAPPLDHAEIAELAVRTLLEIHDVAHPGWLTYRAFHSEGQEILLPGLGLKPE